MAIERERKFLLKHPPSTRFWAIYAQDVETITQGYLVTQDDRSLRIRKSESQERRTTYSLGYKQGTNLEARVEHEERIHDLDMGEALLGMCSARVAKVRGVVECRGTYDTPDFSVTLDVYADPDTGDDVGALMEVEAPDAETLARFKLSDFPELRVAREVSDDPRYLAVNIATHGWPED